MQFNESEMNYLQFQENHEVTVANCQDLSVTVNENCGLIVAYPMNLPQVACSSMRFSTSQVMTVCRFVSFPDFEREFW